MWWPRVLVAVAVAALLAGCGFRPLYGRASGDSRTVAEMASIYIEPVADRDGQLLRNALLDRLNPSGQPRYHLQVQMSVSETPVVLQKDQTVSRNNVSYTVGFTLLEGTTILTKGQVARSFSYDYLSEQYSNISARADVRRRAAGEIATEIRNRLSAYFIRAAAARTAAGSPGPGATADPQ